MKKSAVILAAVWLGMQIMAGYIAAPVLFKTLPKMQAGAIAGELFAVLSYAGLLVWAWVYFVGIWKSAVRDALAGWAVAVLWLCLAVNQLLVTPVIEAHKTHTENWLLDWVGGSFGMWHGISSLIFMICAILAALAVWRMAGRLERY